ncbi:hypothetical protein [Streptomyces sp. NPDC058475]
MNTVDLFVDFDIHVDVEEIDAELPSEDAQFESNTFGCSGVIC